MNNKHHWYDGKFYDYFIAPNQDKTFLKVKELIEPGSSVIDIGCGTGRLAFQLAEHCKSVTGVDLSLKNISVAQSKFLTESAENIKFFHGNAAKLEEENQHFDYAVMSFVIHEVDKELRIRILQLLSKLADNIIIVDYAIPQPKNHWRIINELVEFAAGKDHYINFKSFRDENGLSGLAEKVNLKIIEGIKNQNSSTQILLLINPG